jgi:deoxyribodipyrimidine photo-lyase
MGRPYDRNNVQYPLTVTPVPVHVVWFKRDLRITDHAPLTEAAAQGAVLPLYIVERSLHKSADFDPRHWVFLQQCLTELREALAQLGMALVVRVGEVTPVLSEIHAEYTISALWAHEETGNRLTHARNAAVSAWTKANSVPFYEFPSGGVVRGLASRNEWAHLWEKRMAPAPLAAPTAIHPLEGVTLGRIPDYLGNAPVTHHSLQQGGRRAADDLLTSFLERRGLHYPRAMSSPVTNSDSTSRLSPHLTYGTLSVREVIHAVRERRRDLSAIPNGEFTYTVGEWRLTLRAFESRLRWRDHFIQKLEDEPQIEQHSLIPNVDALFDDPLTDERAGARLAAWEAGKTGYPLVDAVMRSLRAEGYTNFKMRAVVAVFAAYDLALPWQITGRVLARWFTDYEPGIHWNQQQIQSGTSGANRLRGYNPTKQAREHDPNGEFIRRWLPELASVPNDYIHAPFDMPPMLQAMYHCVIGKDYPAPIVEHPTVAKIMIERINALRKALEAQAATPSGGSASG